METPRPKAIKVDELTRSRDPTLVAWLLGQGPKPRARDIQPAHLRAAALETAERKRQRRRERNRRIWKREHDNKVS